MDILAVIDFRIKWIVYLNVTCLVKILDLEIKRRSNLTKNWKMIWIKKNRKCWLIRSYVCVLIEKEKKWKNWILMKRTDEYYNSKYYNMHEHMCIKKRIYNKEKNKKK